MEEDGPQHSQWCRGNVVLGPNWATLVASVVLVTVPAGVFLGLVAPDLGANIHWSTVAVACLMTAVSITSLLVTALSNPGILPRQRQPSDLHLASFPRTKQFAVAGYSVTTKFCPTCNVHRPPRCSHCAICNNCVEKFDHHCPWTGTCIGRGNYRPYLLFIWSTSLLCVTVFTLCLWRIIRLQRGPHRSVTDALKEEPAAALLLLYTLAGFAFVFGLTCFHLYLTLTNQTTYEHFRHRAGAGDNPYSQGLVHNCAEPWCARTELFKYTPPPPRGNASQQGSKPPLAVLVESESLSHPRGEGPLTQWNSVRTNGDGPAFDYLQQGGPGGGGQVGEYRPGASPRPALGGGMLSGSSSSGTDEGPAPLRYATHSSPSEPASPARAQLGGVSSSCGSGESCPPGARNGGAGADDGGVHAHEVVLEQGGE